MEAVDECEGEFVGGADEEEGEDEVGEVGHYLRIQEWVRCVCVVGLRGWVWRNGDLHDCEFPFSRP